LIHLGRFKSCPCYISPYGVRACRPPPENRRDPQSSADNGESTVAGRGDAPLLFVQTRTNLVRTALQSNNFRDIRNLAPETEAATIVKAPLVDVEFEEVQCGLSLLGQEGRIVDWLNESARHDFVSERVKIAFE
jgi:hypothetical protein